jgi:hypothetical protein
MNAATLRRPPQTRNRALCGHYREAGLTDLTRLLPQARSSFVRLAVGVLLVFLMTIPGSRSFACNEPPNPAFWTPGEDP